MILLLIVVSGAAISGDSQAQAGKMPASPSFVSATGTVTKQGTELWAVSGLVMVVDGYEIRTDKATIRKLAGPGR
jgi:hypothetical protein